MIRRPPRSTPLYSSAASDVYKRQGRASAPSPASRSVPTLKGAPREPQGSPRDEGEEGLPHPGSAGPAGRGAPVARLLRRQLHVLERQPRQHFHRRLALTREQQEWPGGAERRQPATRPVPERFAHHHRRRGLQRRLHHQQREPHRHAGQPGALGGAHAHHRLSLIHISEPTRQAEISYAVFCLKKKTRATQNRRPPRKPTSKNKTLHRFLCV